ncbi:response regulator [Wenyingzhuangia sp. chi5]|uniref:histidine kinase n=1 Tax=Wenyingzhuangia gilva TaxID=3057677 RepID=A0ABT8VPY0_9FLAO|nr:response regulator [Wenyingzhuangia sp. chi5]MDO3694024.1 response regulator [Wenyingzhuangia sp. chi5]
MNFNKLPFNIPLPNYSGLSRTEKKRTTLMLTFSFVWIVQSLISVFVVFFEEDYFLKLAGHLFNIIVISIVFFLLYTKKTNSALVLFIGLILVTIILFTNFISPGSYAEYFYLFMAPLVLVLSDNKVIIYSSFISSYLAFILPNYFLHIYPDYQYQESYYAFILFSVNFIMIYYFKSINVRNEKLLEIKTNELQELNQFQSQFFINISHEIKTPLTLIKGQIDKLDVLKNDSKTKHKINKQISNIKKIVDDVIDFSKMNDETFNFNKRVVDLKKLGWKIYTSFDSLFIQKNITFTFEYSDEDFYVLVDALYLERAINNLILNAYKYTEKKGSVVLKLVKQNDNVSILVSDTGIGIEPQNIKKIFNRFYQVNNDFNKTGGSGVGLAFAKEIVEKLEGKIMVKSKPNIGSIFYIIFPFVNDYIPQEKTEIFDQNKNENIDVSSLLSNKNISVLIVDDSFEMRAYLKELLQHYHCFEAENGLEAIELLKTQKIDFVITDYMMPKMNGFEFVTYIKENQILVPVLMLTARSDYHSKIEVLRLGIDDYLNKPFDKNELLIRIQNILKNHVSRKNFLKDENIPNEEIKENTEWVVELKNYILKNCENPKLNQVDIAEHFNISKSTFYRKVKMETGLTPNEFINEVKLLEARKIVENNDDLSLKELSLKVGFLHTTYFANQYKKRFGVHPIKQEQV